MSMAGLVTSLCGDRPPMLVTTATTGVHESDTLIAAFFISPLSRETELVMREVPEDMLAPSREYHGIGSEEMRSYALPDDQALARLDELAQNNTLFGYNPEFQSRYLAKGMTAAPVVLDLPALVQAADMRMAMAQVTGLSELQALALRQIGGKAPSFRSLCRRYGLEPNQVLLPLQASCWQLCGLWDRLAEIPAVR